MAAAFHIFVPSFLALIILYRLLVSVMKYWNRKACSDVLAIVYYLCWVTWIWLIKLACFCNKLFTILSLDTAGFVKLDDIKPSPEIARYDICQQSRQLLWLYTHGLTLTLKSWVKFLALIYESNLCMALTWSRPQPPSWTKFVVPVSSLLGVQAWSLLNLRLSFMVFGRKQAFIYTHMCNTVLLVTIYPLFIHYW